MNFSSYWGVQSLHCRKKMVREKIEKQELEIVQIVLLLAWENSILLDKNSFTASHSKPFCELLNVKLFKVQTPLEVLCKTSVLKSFTKFAGKHLCWSLFISGDFLKKRLVFLCVVCKFFQDIYLVDTWEQLLLCRFYS